MYCVRNASQKENAKREQAADPMRRWLLRSVLAVCACALLLTALPGMARADEQAAPIAAEAEVIADVVDVTEQDMPPVTVLTPNRAAPAEDAGGASRTPRPLGNNVLMLALGAMSALLVLLVVLLLLRRHKHRSRALTASQKTRTAEMPQNTAETVRRNVSSRDDTTPVNKEDNEDMDAGDTRPYVTHGHDYTEDVSRYTQQPSPDVNDVSRYTHGAGLPDDDNLQRVAEQTAPQTVARTPRPSVGSRVARKRAAKRRKR